MKQLSVAIFVQNSAFYDQRVSKQIAVFSALGINVKLFPILTDRDDESRILNMSNIEIHYGAYGRKHGLKNWIFWIANSIKHKISRRLINAGFSSRWVDYHFCGPCTSIFLKTSSDHTFDLIYANDLNTVPAVLSIANKRKIAFVYDAHELYSEESSSITEREKESIKRVEKLACTLSALNITVSGSIAIRLRQLYSLKNEPAVIRNIPLINNVDRELRSTYSDERIRLVYHTANLSLNGRNVKDLIDAIALCTSNVSLTLIGNMDDRSKRVLFGYIEQKACLNSKIFVHGAFPYNELISFIKKFDVGIILNHPSVLNNNLGIPNKMFEYMACGLAIISFKTVEIEKVFKKFDIGLLTHTADSKGLLDAITKIASRPEDLHHYKVNSQTAHLTEFNWANESNVFTSQLMSVVRSI